MKLNKKFLTALILGFVFLIGEVQANDGFGINYDPKHDFINCITIKNADEFNKNGLYLYFDYSIESGQKLGRPWTRVESGKCYEYSTNIDDPSQFLMIKTESSDFLNYLDTSAKYDFDTFSERYSNFVDDFTAVYEKYKDNFSLFLNVEDNDGTPFKHEGLGRDVYINNYNEIDMQVFKYNFEHGITSVISNGNGEDLLSQYLIENGRADLSSRLFSVRKEIIKSLKDYSTEISSKFNLCLSDIKRIEFHENAIYEDEYTQKFESAGIYILNKDSQLIKVNKLYDYLDFECKQSVYKIHEKWIDEINKKGDIYYSTVQEIREFQSKNPDWVFALYDEVGSLEDYIPWSLDYIVGLNENILEIDEPQINEQSDTAAVSDIEPSNLDSDDVSLLQNMKNNINSINDNDNFLFYLYIVLPLVAVIIGLLIYYRRRV